MPDTKRGREEQARHQERRQREREIEQARERADEREPPTDRSTEGDETGTEDAGPSGGQTCHRRGCDRPAAFLVTERYLEDTGHGAVEATAELCRDHTAEESPTRLDDAYPDYVFRVEPLSGSPESTSNDGS
ncbi:hypothetical protein [Salinigranum sp. GCM10025319]|uniref:hypothetical protein n=1 Tax=Salinigranum sp. GCM10025319 TaxID=3252687 RepID=UPI0036214FE1